MAFHKDWEPSEAVNFPTWASSNDTRAEHLTDASVVTDRDTGRSHGSGLLVSKETKEAEKEERREERDQLVMDSDSKKKSPYGAAMSEDWESMIDHYKSNPSDLFHSVTSVNDTALHVAVCSKTEQPLKDLLALLPSIDQENLLKRRNNYGNTVLHEATIYGNFEAVELLVELYPDLVSIRNNYGETPLFTAAEFAEAKIVKFLLESVSQQIVDEDGRLLSIHCQRSGKRRSDNVSILSAAILGQHHDTALMLLELDESLHSLEDDKGITALQLLADSPSAFKSGYPMEMHERLVYSCLPVTPPHKVKKSQEETSGQASQWLGDLESGLGRTPRGCLLNYLNVFIKGIGPY
ncbi:unnamed protein product [Dovyalis caffra]|uniref:Uncharacterized protein n=1 Tax=Dovyalis caffra TaxID=77055 RepID=A0AAV1SLM0_9ROSI|nr:unnamed protein product [Dovyalis caffra]